MCLRLRALPMPRYGQAPHVFTLGRKGRTYLQRLGFPVEPYFRPSEERRATENSPFMTHRLAAIDVMIAADRLCADNAIDYLPAHALRAGAEAKRSSCPACQALPASRTATLP